MPDFQSWSLITLGSLTVFSIGYALWAGIKRNATRSDAEGSLDQRNLELLDTMLQKIVSPLTDMLQATQGELHRANDARDAATNKLIEYSDKAETKHAETYERLRIEYKAELERSRLEAKTTHERLGDRLEKCEDRHREDAEARRSIEAEQQRTLLRVRDLENRERENLRAQIPSGYVAPAAAPSTIILQQPSAAAPPAA